MPGDYDGDGITDLAVFRPTTGTWFIVPSSHPATPLNVVFGGWGDVPVPGDYDGDGKTDLGIFRAFDRRMARGAVNEQLCDVDEQAHWKLGRRSCAR